MEKHNAFRPYRRAINEYIDEIEQKNGDDSILSTEDAKARCIEILQKKHESTRYKTLATDSFSLLIPSVFAGRGYNSVVYGAGYYIKGMKNMNPVFVYSVMKNTNATKNQKLRYLAALKKHNKDIPGQINLFGGEEPSPEDILEELRADYENQEVAV